jgi:hypothetical protein
MTRRLLLSLFAGVLAAAVWSTSAAPARAQMPASSYTPISHYFYYPYYYFPHSYWPAMSPRWPEPPSAYANGFHPSPYPAYMAYPPFKEPHWRYEFWEPQSYYRGFHFWLDQL